MNSFLKEIASLKIFFTRRDASRYAILLGLMIAGALFEAVGIGAIPAFVTMIIDPSVLSSNRWIGPWIPALPSQPTANLVMWASVGLLLIIVCKNIFLSFVGYIQVRIVERQRLTLSNKMFRAYQAAPYEWHLARSSNELLRNISGDTNQILTSVLLPILELVMGSLMTLFIVLAMLFGSTGSVLVSVLINGAGMMLVIRLLHKRLRNIGKVRRNESKESFKAIQQAFGALVESRLLQRDTYLFDAYRSSNARLARAGRIQSTVQIVTPYIIETITILGLLIVIALLMRSKTEFDTLIPTISLLAIAALRLKQMAQKISHSVNMLSVGRAFIPGIVNDYRELGKLQRKEAATRSTAPLITGFHELTLDGVSYQYPSSHQPAVREVSLQLRRGESIAFVGQTGCGKTTLANLILGLLVPSEGKIAVNGIVIHHDLSGWWRQVAYIPQTIYLIDDTIRANIAFGLPRGHVADADVWEALGSARMDDFVRSLPQGLHTIVGERGVRLSGGQRQRIGIARALYVKPQVLLMDEATSALDNKTEDEVKQAISELRSECTLIMIAHRLSTVQDCDRVYFLRDGRLEEEGAFDEILERSESFRTFVGGSIQKNQKSAQTVIHEA